ncbi:non-heme iron oxygenase ferredoxin subunit [Patescibacteria group bacterium]|nr:non-heme iron oxygenase ferredoxin subunit [Patescibacteria group bacterium]
MPDFVKVAAAGDIPDGSMKTVETAGKKIALAHIGESFFAIDDACSHHQCSLGGEGVLDGTTVVCGCHGAKFDVTSGKVLALPATTDVRSYRTKVEGGDVFVEL